MAKGRGGRGPSRMDLRRQSEAAEARENEEVEEIEDETEEDEESDSEGDLDGEIDDDAIEGEAEDVEIDEEADLDDEGMPKKSKKKKKPAKAKASAKPKKTKSVKIVRQKAVWKVFDNGGKIMGTFPFPEKAEAEALLASKIAEKEGKVTFYLQLVKEPLEE